MPARLRAATLADIPTIDSLAREIWPRVFTDVVSMAQIEYMLDWMYDHKYLAADMKGDTIFQMLEDSGDAIGFLSYSPTWRTAVWQLHKIYVLPEKHRGGYGRMMLAHTEDAVRKAGADTLILRTHRYNRRALRFYYAHGYRIEELLCQEIGGGFRMFDYRLAKRLT